MKTTIEIADRLIEEARATAAKEGTTLRQLVEEGLRRILAERRKPAAAFRLRKVTFKGKGLRPALADESWDRIRDLAYEGRGS